MTDEKEPKSQQEKNAQAEAWGVTIGAIVLFILWLIYF